MRKAILAVICTIFVFGTIATSHAAQGDWRGEIRSRIQVSNHKIDQGVKRGSLTGPEAYRLKQELGTILLKLNYMKADGYLNQRERNKVNYELDKLDRKIFREKHDTAATGHAAQGDWRGGIRSRIQKSKQKIAQGIERRTLNRHEADKLYAELDTILDKIDHMKADGYLSQGERDRIQRDLDRLDKDIFKEKHDHDQRH